MECTIYGMHFLFQVENGPVESQSYTICYNVTLSYQSNDTILETIFLTWLLQKCSLHLFLRPLGQHFLVSSHYPLPSLLHPRLTNLPQPSLSSTDRICSCKKTKGRGCISISSLLLFIYGVLFLNLIFSQEHLGTNPGGYYLTLSPGQFLVTCSRTELHREGLAP